jgi:hypothetical protein
MRVRYLLCCALLSLAGPAQAYLIGNPLGPREQASDLQPYVYNVFFGSPITSHGSIDSISIFQMDFANLPEFCDSFTLRLLRPTEAAGVYHQYYTSQVFGIYGPTNAVQTYWLSEPVEVQPGDLFATYGGGISFSDTALSVDTYFFTGSDFAPVETGLIQLGTQPYIGNRNYAAAVNFVSAPGSTDVPEAGSLAFLLAGGISLLGRRGMRREDQTQ